MSDLPPLRPYQERGWRACLERQRVGLAFQPGLGKTLTVLRALRMGFDIEHVCIIGPKRVVEQVWRQEAAKWGEVDPASMYLLTSKDFDICLPKRPAGAPMDWRPAGAPSDWREGELMFRDVAAARARIRKIVQLHRIILVSWSAVHWLAWALSDRHWFDAVVLDESGYAGNRTTRRWQVARALCKHAGCVWALNGTPMTGKPESVFGQSWLIDQGATFGRTLGDFRQRFLRPSRFGPQGRVLDWGDPTPAQQAEMQGCFERLWIPVRAKDWLQLPDLIVNDVFVDLQEQHWRAVSALVRGALAQVGGASVLPASAGAGVAKAAQLCGGDLYDDAGESSHLHDEKLDAVEELVEQADGGVLLFWLYKNHEASLRKRLGRALVGIDEPDAVARWARGEVKVLGAHPEKVAVGLNLQHGGSTQIWFGPTYSSFWWEQGVARTQRQGQEAPSVIVHRVMTRHPFERGIVDVCEGKLSLLEALMSVAKGPEYGE